MAEIKASSSDPLSWNGDLLVIGVFEDSFETVGTLDARSFSLYIDCTSSKLINSQTKSQLSRMRS